MISPFNSFYERKPMRKIEIIAKWHMIIGGITTAICSIIYIIFTGIIDFDYYSDYFYDKDKYLIDYFFPGFFLLMSSLLFYPIAYLILFLEFVFRKDVRYQTKKSLVYITKTVCVGFFYICIVLSFFN